MKITTQQDPEKENISHSKSQKRRVAISKRGIYVQYKAIERPGKSEMTLIRNI